MTKKHKPMSEGEANELNAASRDVTIGAPQV